MPARPTNLLDLYPPIEKPRHIPAHVRPELFRLGRIATAALMSRLPPHWRDPYAPAEARARLTSWTRELDDHIRESTGFAHVCEYITGLPDPDVDQVERWLRGGWDDDAESLQALLWHCDFSQRLVSAAMWLHRIGCEDFGPAGRAGNVT